MTISIWTSFYTKAFLISSCDNLENYVHCVTINKIAYSTTPKIILNLCAYDASDSSPGKRNRVRWLHSEKEEIKWHVSSMFSEFLLIIL